MIPSFSDPDDFPGVISSRGGLAVPWWNLCPESVLQIDQVSIKVPSNRGMLIRTQWIQDDCKLNWIAMLGGWTGVAAPDRVD